MTSKFDGFKDVELSADAQDVITGGLTPSEAKSFTEATKNGLGRVEIFRIMVERMKILEQKALLLGDFETAQIHEAERCKMELALGGTW